MIVLKKLAIFLPVLLFPLEIHADESAIDCLTKNIYFEAKNQSIAGQIAVALVVLNRVKDKRFPIQFVQLYMRDQLMKVGRHVKFLIYQNNQENTILVETDVSFLGTVTANLIIQKNLPLLIKHNGLLG